MGKKPEAKNLSEPKVPTGYGRLVSVVPFGPEEVILWFEDTGGNVRGVRMACDRTHGFAMEALGEARIART